MHLIINVLSALRVDLYEIQIAISAFLLTIEGRDYFLKLDNHMKMKIFQ